MVAPTTLIELLGQKLGGDVQVVPAAIDIPTSVAATAPKLSHMAVSDVFWTEITLRVGLAVWRTCEVPPAVIVVLVIVVGILNALVIDDNIVLFLNCVVRC